MGRKNAITHTPSRVPAHIRRKRAAERARAGAEVVRATKPVDIVHVSSSEEEEEDEEDEVYEVERILSHRMSKRYPGTKEYLIKWKNYDQDSNTWENEKNVFSEELLKQYWDEQKKEKDNKRKPVVSSSSSSSSSPSPSPSTSVKKRKQVVDRENTVPVATDPPSGLEWKDAQQVVHIFADRSNELFARVEWSDNQSTLCRTSILRDEIPGLLIDFYEKHLAFRDTKESSPELV